MPLAPINVSSTTSADSLTILWDRPADATILGFRVSWGTSAGQYTVIVDLGDVREYEIVLPANQAAYAVVQSFDNATPSIFSDISIEQKRVFPVASVITAVAVPNALAPAGGVNDVLWVNPNDVNLAGVDVRRSNSDLTPFDLSLAVFGNPGTLFSGETLYYAVAWHPDTVGAPYGAPSLRVSGGPLGFHYRSEIKSITVSLDNFGVRATVTATTGVPVSGEGTYILLRATSSAFTDATVVDSVQPALAPTYDLDDNPVGAPVPLDEVPFLDAPLIVKQVNPINNFSDTGVTNGERYQYYLKTFDFSDNTTVTPVRSVSFSAGTNLVTLVSHGFVDGQLLAFSSVDPVASLGLIPNAKYYVRNTTANTFQLSLTSSSVVLSIFVNGTGTTLEDESQFGPEVATDVVAQQLLGSSPPSDVTGLSGTNLGTSIVLRWNPNPESNIDHYEIKWALSLVDLAGSPTVIDVGTVTDWVLSGFTPVDDVYVQVFAVDDGFDETGAPKTPEESLDSDVFERVVEQSNIRESFVSQIDLSNDVSFIWSNVQNVAYFEVEIDSDPSFSTPNKQILTRYLKVEDLVLIAEQHSMAQQLSVEIPWYWRVRPVYPGAVNGFWFTQIRTELTLNGDITKQLGLDDGGDRLSNVPYEAEFIENALVVTSIDGLTTYTLGVDYEFTGTDQIGRLAAGSITDGQTVVVNAEFIKTFTVGKDERIVARDHMNNTLDPLFYSVGSRTTNIFKWFDAISVGAMAPYLIDQGRLAQGRFINTTDPDELYERWGGLVALITGEVPVPDAFAAIKGLVPAFLSAGTKNSIEKACFALTGAPCTITQAGTGAGSGWILYDDDGPPPGLPEYVFDDLDPTPDNHFVITLADFDELYNYNIVVRNAARGAQKEIVRSSTEQTDLLGTGNIVVGSVRIIDEFDVLVADSRYTIDHVNGIITWNVGQEVAAGSTYTAIYGVYINELIERIFNLLLPAHVNPIYTFQPTSISESLGLLVWDDALWDTTEWGS